MILLKEVINYFWLSEVIFQLFVSKCKLRFSAFWKNVFTFTEGRLGRLLRFLAGVMADHIPWESGGSVGKEKWLNVRSLSSSDARGRELGLRPHGGPTQWPVQPGTFLYLLPPSKTGMNRTLSLEDGFWAVDKRLLILLFCVFIFSQESWLC